MVWSNEGINKLLRKGLEYQIYIDHETMGKKFDVAASHGEVMKYSTKIKKINGNEWYSLNTLNFNNNSSS